MTPAPSAAGAPTVRVGIVAWNCADALRACLAAMPAALGGLPAEVVVVDNASHDDSVAVAEAAGATVVRSGANLGYARAMNRALAGPPVDVVLACNPDTVPAPGSLAALVDVLVHRPDVGVVAPLLRDPDGSVQHSVHRFPTVGLAAVVGLVPHRWVPPTLRDRLWLSGSVRPGRSGPVDWATGAVHAIRSAALEGAPPYRERWFVYVEDVDLCHRLGRRGWQTWFAGDVEVVHTGNVSGAQAFGEAREDRWLNETYDWYGLVHGAGAARRYAAVNLAGTLARCVGALGRSLAGGAGARARLRRWWRASRLHARVVVGGPPPPAPPLD